MLSSQPMILAASRRETQLLASRAASTVSRRSWRRIVTASAGIHHRRPRWTAPGGLARLIRVLLDRPALAAASTVVKDHSAWAAFARLALAHASFRVAPCVRLRVRGTSDRTLRRKTSAAWVASCPRRDDRYALGALPPLHTVYRHTGDAGSLGPGHPFHVVGGVDHEPDVRRGRGDGRGSSSVGRATGLLLDSPRDEEEARHFIGPVRSWARLARWSTSHRPWPHRRLQDQSSGVPVRRSCLSIGAG